MSDGMSDATACGRLAGDLREAAYKLRDAIKAAESGHRGMSVPIISTVDPILNDCGFEIRRLPR